MKKILISLALALVMVLGLFTVGSAEERSKVSLANGEEMYETGLPILDADSGVVFSIMGDTIAPDPNEFPMVKKYYEDTGVKINWIGISSDGLAERLSLMFASQSYPDVIGPGINIDPLEYASMGMLIPLNEYYEKYLTTLRENLGSPDEWDRIRSYMTYPDGNIYAFPTIMPYYYADTAVPVINRSWLDALGMDMPETPDDFVAYLRAVKETDLNGNGKNDEVPFGVSNATHWAGGACKELYSVAAWTGEMAGVKYVSDGKVMYPLTSDAVREAAAWLNGLYEEGMMELEVFTQDENMWMAKAKEKDLVYGFTCAFTEPYVLGDNAIHYFPMKPLMGEAGTRMWFGAYDDILISEQLYVTDACEYPEVVARFVDYLYNPLIRRRARLPQTSRPTVKAA